jgi:riboflavin kinase/FMN adenylyltransferase
VVRGGRWGRRLGFPTANIYPNHEVIPPAGVYIARAFLNKNILKGLCYIGNRPSFSKGAEDIPNINIEMYILDFNRNLYGKDLEIQFIKKIRNERKFTSLASLSQQIKKDIKLSQSYFNPP